MGYKKKKNVRQRGKTTHGWGAKKKHRGAGNRGGRGMAGSGKRADQKKPTILKMYGSSYFGKKGFKTHRKSDKKIINLSYIQDNLDKIAEKKDNVYFVDVKKLGFNKVLGTGKLTKKLNITAQSFSKKSIDKIKKAGGEAVKCS